jgi:hypothetical protein
LENNQQTKEIKIRNGEKMLKSIVPILLVLAVLLTACGGAEATPTMNPADVQGTAVAAAWTMVAMTQQSIPTATQLPPTETPSPTPLPTFTPPALASSGTPGTPTQNIFVGAPTSTSASSNSCLSVLNMGEAGPTKRVRIENTSGGIANLSLNLNPKNLFGQCGVLQYPNVGKNVKFIIEIPNGSWYAYAWITLPGGDSSTAEGSFYFGPSDATELNRLVIEENIIRLVGP